MPGVSGKARRPGEQEEGSKGANPEMRHRGKEGGRCRQEAETLGLRAFPQNGMVAIRGF